MFSCAHCSKNFYKFHLYLAHIRHVHSHQPFFRYVCGFNGCPITCVSFFSLKSHLFRHDELKSTSNKKITCVICGFSSYLKQKFISHFKQHDTIICPIVDCKQIYTVYSSFTSHLSRCHPIYTIHDFYANAPPLSTLDKAVVQSFNDNSTIEMSNEEMSNKIIDIQKKCNIVYFKNARKIPLATDCCY